MKKILLPSLFIILFLIPLSIFAHKPNQSYIFLRVYEKDGIEGRFEMNIDEVNKVFGLNLTRATSAKDMLPYIEDLKAYLFDNTKFSSKYGNHNIVFTDFKVGTFGDFVKVFFTLGNTKKLPDDLDVSYNAVFEKDNSHRGFLITEYNWRAGVINEEANISLSFTPTVTAATLDLTDVSLWKGFVAMIKQGIWHIWIGIDHILFLLALILPSVVRRKEKIAVAKKKADAEKHKTFGWQPVLKFKPAFLYILKIVTFFTIAHTITLSLASLDIVQLPSRFVESIIAISIGLAAFHNIRPIFKGRDWAIAFIFGLFHGFGFASVLGDLGLTGEFLTLSLLGFNIGVEIGQLLIIALIFPILFVLRKSKIYPMLLVYGSVLLIVVSLYWFIERAFDIDLLIYEYVKSKIRKLAVFLGLWS